MGKGIFLYNNLDVSVECPAATRDKGISVIRGWREKEYVLMDIPKFKHAFPMNSYQQATWLVRYVHEGEVVGFRVKGKISIPPCNLFALEYPNKIETHLLRKQLRASLNVPVRLYSSLDPEDNINYKGITTDISAGGVRIKLSEKIKNFDSYYLSIYLPTGGALKNVSCKIIKSAYTKRGCELGIAFLNITEDQKKMIDACLQQFCDYLDDEDGLLPGEKK